MLCAKENGLIIGTARNMTVPFIVNIHETRPFINDDDWDQIVECGIDLPSGVLSIFGTTDYIGDYKKIDTGPGTYNALICYAGLGTISEDGMEGNDNYVLNIWPGSTLLPKKVIKQWTP